MCALQTSVNLFTVDAVHINIISTELIHVLNLANIGVNIVYSAFEIDETASRCDPVG